MSYQNVIFTLILTPRKHFNNIAVKIICIYIAHSLQCVSFITTITLYLFLIRLVSSDKRILKIFVYFLRVYKIQ